MKKYGIAIIAAVLLVAAAFAGAASAAGITTASELVDQLGSGNASASGNVVTLSADVQLPEELVFMNSAGITLDLNGHTLTAATGMRLFKVNRWGDAPPFQPSWFTLSDSSGGSGKLVGNGAVAGNGGAVLVENGVFTMNGGNITGCRANLGGGVYVDSGVFTMNGGTITNCSATNSGGGGVYVYGTFTMSGGSITNCSATNNGGGVLLSAGIFTMTGGTITGCSATNSGGGVMVTDGTFTMNSMALVDETNAVHLAYSKNIILGAGGFSAGHYGAFNITPQTTTAGTLVVDGTVNGVQASTANFALSPSFAGKMLEVDGKNLIIADKPIEVSTWEELVSNVTNTGAGSSCTIVVMTNLINNTAGGTAGTYAGIPVTGKIVIKPKASAGEIKIDANQMGRLFIVQNGGDLTLKGNTGSTLNLTGGNITTLGTYKGGAIYVNTNGKLTLSTGANIANCNASGSSSQGGGVYVYNGGTFTMTGGTITGCGANQGGGVAVFTGSTFTMTGGTISGCSATTMGGGVVGMSGSTFTMSGGTIKDCSADQGGGGVAIEAEFIMNGTALITGDNDVYLYSGNIVLGAGGFASGHYGAFNITPVDTTAGTVIVNGTVNGVQASIDNFALAPSFASKMLEVDGKNLIIANKPIEVSTWDELVSNVTGYSSTEMRTIVVTQNLINSSGTAGAYDGIPVTGKIVIMPASASVTIDANQKGRLFDVKSGGDLTLKGNGAATLTLKNGKLSSTTTNSFGGTIYVDSGNLMLATGANIKDGVVETNVSDGSSSGGAVYLINTGIFSLCGGNITNCTAHAFGNNARSIGGAVHVDLTSKFIMYDGCIEDCQSTYVGTSHSGYAGGVYVDSSGTFMMSGGIIRDCSAATYGGGMVVYGSFTMNGTALVDETNDVYLGSNLNITIGTNGFASGHYGAFNISPKNLTAGTVVVDGTTNNVQASMDNFALSPSVAGRMLDVSGKNLVLKLGARVSTWEQLVAAVEGHSGSDMLNVLVTTNLVNSTGPTGTYPGINVSAPVTIMPASASVTIDANQMGRLFDVKSGGDLTLKGNGAATLTLTGGSFTNCGGIYVYDGKLTLATGSIITGCSATSGGAVYVKDAGSTFTMTGGTITGCSATNSGGGVFVTDNGQFFMNDGTISGCSATNSGGGVSTSFGGSFTMTGGTITGCSAGTNGGGVYNGNNVKFIMNGTALVTGDNDVYLSTDSIYPDAKITLGAGGFQLGHYGAFSITPQNTTIGAVVVDGTTNGVQASMDNFALSPAYTTVQCKIAAPSGNNLVITAASYVVQTWSDLKAKVEGGYPYILVKNTITSTESSGFLGIDVNKTVTIMPAGESVSIDANQMGRLFYIKNGGDLTLRGNGDRTLTLMNGNMNKGGAIFIDTGILNLANGVIITKCSSDFGGAVYTKSSGSGTVTMTGGTITKCSVSGSYATAGGMYLQKCYFNINGTATVFGNTANGVADNVYLYRQSTDPHYLKLTGPFIGTVGIVNPTPGDTSKFGEMTGGATDADARNLVSDTHAGYAGKLSGSDIEWNKIDTSVPASPSGVAVFGHNNFTNLSAGVSSTVSSVVLEDVGGVSGNVRFQAYSTTVDPIPTDPGCTKVTDVAVFEIDAGTTGTSTLNLTVTFASASEASANIDKIRVWHYNRTSNDWDTPSLQITGKQQTGEKITYTVETTSFSPFGISIETGSSGGSPSYSGGSSSSKNYGGSMWTENPNDVPTAAPTVAPTAAPVYDTPTQVPTALPTQSQKSPAPVAGLIAGLGIAAVLLRLRR